MAEDMNAIRMATSMKVSSRMARQMVRVFTLGQTERFMMVNGRMVLKKAMESGEESMVTLI
jgi:hypothetical protein